MCELTERKEIELSPEEICAGLNNYDSGKGWRGRTDWIIREDYANNGLMWAYSRGIQWIYVEEARALVHGWKAEVELLRRDQTRCSQCGIALGDSWCAGCAGSADREKLTAALKGLADARADLDQLETILVVASLAETAEARQEITRLEKILAAARAVINNQAWAGVCDEDVLLEQAIHEYDKEHNGNNVADESPDSSAGSPIQR